MITKTFKLTIATDTEEQMQKEEEHLSMLYGADEIEEDKTGKWINLGTTTGSIPYIVRECSRCGYVYSMTANFRYCPMCGANMEVEK